MGVQRGKAGHRVGLCWSMTLKGWRIQKSDDEAERIAIAEMQVGVRVT